ncbi:MAG: hypothetical protein JXR76_28035 [Deltaproteobacteria bacterium]|nr:hypothetical protein [Deltaproteobacteria bacterium]
MKLFLLGASISSFIWLTVVYAQSQGFIEVFEPPQASDEIVTAPFVPDTEVDIAVEAPKKKKRIRRKRRYQNQKAPAASDLGYETGEGESGDELQAGTRNVAMGGGGEEQLSNGEIENAIDQRFNGIQRCLTLMPPDAPNTGKLVIGISISGDGSVTQVNLKGPNAMVKGDTGACFRRIVKAIRFRSFNGPDMIVHYPIIFE